MNANTRRQWERHIVTSALKMTDRFVLYWLVNDHSAVEGFTRPGLRRLERMTGATRETVIASLARLVEHGSIRLHREGEGRRADEYVIPWLHNPTRAEVGNPTANPTANPTPSSPLRGERRSAAREGVAAALRAPDDATDAVARCACCEEPIDGLTECPVAELIADGHPFTNPCHLQTTRLDTTLRLVGQSLDEEAADG